MDSLLLHHNDLASDFLMRQRGGLRRRCLSFNPLTLGFHSLEQQHAWRQKMGLLPHVLTLMASVGFLAFGFTEAVCETPATRFHGIPGSFEYVSCHLGDMGKIAGERGELLVGKMKEFCSVKR